MKTLLDNTALRYYTQIQLIESSIRELNPQFSLCDVLVCAHGANDNKTYISKQAVEEAIPSLYGIPIVGEVITLNETTGEFDWGGHGGRLSVNSQGMTWEETTRPFGFVTQEAAENASWIKLLDHDGQEREYLKLSGCVLWTERYEECNSILEHSAGQSMEIKILQGKPTKNGYMEIKRFIFSALCILGDSSPPCFNNASIYKHEDKFQKEYERMLGAYQHYVKKEDEGMHENVAATLAGFTINNAPRYALLSGDGQCVFCIDRSDYKAYQVQYTVDGQGVVTFNFEGCEEKPLGIGTDRNDFSIAAEMEHAVSRRVAAATEQVIEGLNTKLAQSEAKYAKLADDYKKAQTQIQAFEADKAAAEYAKHKEAVEAKMDEYAANMGTFSEFLLYRANVDYSKPIEQVDTDCMLLLGKFNKRKSTAYQAVIASPPSTTMLEGSSRYGNLFDKIAK